MSDVRLTNDQQRAVETLGQVVSVSAGAGSGKTEVLVQRFCKIVADKQADVDEILTVTFTEKAAKEMKQRIIAEFSRLSQGEDGRRFEEARRKVESAYIGTIHAFATRLLRENAFEAGIDPQPGVLDEVESASLRESILEDLIANSYKDGLQECVDLLSGIGKQELKLSILGFHRHLQSLGKSVEDINSSMSEGSAVASESLDQYLGLIDDLMQMLDDGTVSGALANKLLEVRQEYEELKVIMRRLCESMIQNGSDAAAYTRNFDWDLYEEASRAPKLIALTLGSKDIKESHTRPAREHVTSFLESLLMPMGEHYVHCLKQMTKVFQENYTSAKRNTGVLDFDDLLIGARNLLISNGNPSPVAEEYRSTLKFVTMDEFQDTNSLQKSIVDAVCVPGSFFSVGDVKQSIYGFNNADVDVFIGHHAQVKNDSGSTDIAFTDNFRSRSEILDFVNWLFEDIWREDAGFDFEKLEAKSEFAETEDSNVEVLLVPQESDKDQARVAEAYAIAARINELLGRNGGKPFQVTRKRKPDDKPRDIQQGDIMILFRSTSSMPIYERALSDAGIAYYVVSGRGFYDTHEVRDILHLLKVVDNPLDDVAMAAVLRSPLVGISDDTLWWLTRKPGNGGADANREIGKLYDGLRSLDGFVEIKAEERKKLSGFLDLLHELHGVSAGSKITALLDIALEHTGYDLKVLASDNGKRKYANIRKIIDLAQGFETNSLLHLSDFIRHIENLKVIAEREGEAPTETEESQVVRLMTVHKAKGLQSPVVIVADTSRALNIGNSNVFVFSKNHGAACKIRNIATDDWVLNKRYSEVTTYLRNKDLQEEKRLFYVAATRAEELLILSGSSKYDGKMMEKDSYDVITSWSGWLEKALSITETPENGRALLPVEVTSVDLLDGSSMARIQPVRTGSISSTEERLDRLRQEESTEDRAVHPVVERCYASPMSCREAPLIMTVTRILDYLTCPRKYCCRWVLGVQDRETEPEDRFSEASDQVSTATVGSAVHQVMRAVDFTQPLGPQFDSLILLQPESVQPEVAEACLSFSKSPWASRIRNGSRWLQEVPLRVMLDSCDFRGVADLLFMENGKWVVVDYKTGSSVASKRYRQQVGIYALACEKCLGMMPTEIAILSLGAEENHSYPVDRQLLDETHSMLVNISKGIRSEAFEARRSSSCQWCAYRSSLCSEDDPPADPESDASSHAEIDSIDPQTPG